MNRKTSKKSDLRVIVLYPGCEHLKNTSSPKFSSPLFYYRPDRLFWVFFSHNFLSSWLLLLFYLSKRNRVEITLGPDGLSAIWLWPFPNQPPGCFSGLFLALWICPCLVLVNFNRTFKELSNLHTHCHGVPTRWGDYNAILMWVSGNQFRCPSRIHSV